jgi:hypothetical protein
MGPLRSVTTVRELRELFMTSGRTSEGANSCNGRTTDSACEYAPPMIHGVSTDVANGRKLIVHGPSWVRSVLTSPVADVRSIAVMLRLV